MFMGKEPAVFFGGIGQIFAAIIPALIVFDIIHWTDKQIAGIMFLTGVTIRFLTVLFTRKNVVSIETANSQIQTAIKASPDSGVTVEDIIATTKENRDELS